MSIISPSTTELLKRLWQYISRRRRRQFGMLLLLMLLASLAEVISISAVLPFLGVMTAPERVFEHDIAQPMIRLMGVKEPSQLLIPLTIAFGVAALAAGALRLLLLWASTRLSFAAGADISIEIYRRTLYQPYAVHCARNSSELINGITGKANSVIYSIIVPTLTLISSTVMLVAILIALFTIDPVIAITAFAGFGLIYGLIIRLTRKQLLIDSRIVASESTRVIKSLQEGLGGIRDVLIDGSQATYCKTYQNADLQLRHAQANNLFIAYGPRYAMEALGMVLIAALSYSLAKQSEGIFNAIPILGALAMGAQRLLPILQQTYASYSQIQSGQSSLEDTLNLLDQPLPKYAYQTISKPLRYQQKISLNQLSFCYKTATQQVLSNINLTIVKGSRVGFIGATGSGKSTLLDIIMCLLEPSSGNIEVDGIPITVSNQRAWQQNIAHVPQSIFLADSTIEENIAFGVDKDKIDRAQVYRAATQAQISETIEKLPEKYQTIVGERGIRFSGGQRQRIGIARALYKKASVIIFDEATSALDIETEDAVMRSLEGINKEITLLIIAHRLTTLKNCNQIVELTEGRIKRVGSYQDIIN